MSFSPAVWQDAVRSKKRLFVCGLALDFCVLDTCLNAGSSRMCVGVWRVALRGVGRVR